MSATAPIVSGLEDVAIATALMNEEMERCTLCGNGWQPKHFRCYVRGSSLVNNSNCGSNSRRYDPITKTLVGRPHCTCDYCF